MKKYLLFSSTFALACLSASTTKAQNYGLTLSGTNNYVNCGSNALLASTNIRTMECWVKFTDFTGNQEILSRSTIGSGIELLLYNNNLSFYCMNNLTVPAATSFISYPISNLSINTWYHVAASWDNTKENMRLYVNGVSVGSRTDIGNVNGGLSLPTGNFMIGQWSSDATESRLLKGTVDEVRIWSTNRSATQIKAGMYANYMAGATGLLAYYPFDESTGTTVNNMITTGVPAASIVGTVTRVVSPVKFASNALNFDGINDKVTVPASNLFELTSGTIECWIHPTSFSTTYAACLVGNRGTGGTRYSIHINQTSIGLWNGTTWQTISYPFTPGNWYHVAFVSDASVSKTHIYINGVYQNYLPYTFGTLTGQPLTIGASSNSGGDGEWFSGDIDDVRLWNTVRTPQEIAGKINTPLSGTETGLVAYYTFNTGINAAVNTGLNIAIDGTTNNLHGTLTNFNLTGSVSNYVSSNVLILPVQLSAFTAAKSGSTSILNWTTAQEQNSKSFIVECSNNGGQFLPIGTVAASRNTNAATSYSFVDFKPVAGTNYYRLQLVDADGKASYSKTIAIKFPQAEVVNISPNPASSTLNYSVSSLQTTKATVSIISAAGQKVWVSTTTVQAGSNKLSVDVSRLPAGNYTLQVLNTPAGIASSQQFSIAR